MKKSFIFILSIAFSFWGCNIFDNEEINAEEKSITINATGVTDTLKVINGNNDTIQIDTSGQYTFPKKLVEKTVYNIEIIDKPDAYNCSIVNGQGALNDDVNDIFVNCVLELHNVSVTVYGLSGELILLNNDNDTLIIDSSGYYTFFQNVKKGDQYNVTILSKPISQNCEITNNQGALSGDINNIFVNCMDNVYRVGGYISGLNGTLVLNSKYGKHYLYRNGEFEFDYDFYSGDSITVSIEEAPIGLNCTIENNIGVIDSQNYNGLNIKCVDPIVGSWKCTDYYDDVQFHTGGGIANSPFSCWVSGWYRNNDDIIIIRSNCDNLSLTPVFSNNDSTVIHVIGNK